MGAGVVEGGTGGRLEGSLLRDARLAGDKGWLLLEESSLSGIVVASNSIVADSDYGWEVLFDESDDIDESSDCCVGDGGEESPSPSAEEEESS